MGSSNGTGLDEKNATVEGEGVEAPASNDQQLPSGEIGDQDATLREAGAQSSLITDDVAKNVTRSEQVQPEVSDEVHVQGREVLHKGADQDAQGDGGSERTSRRHQEGIQEHLLPRDA